MLDDFSIGYAQDDQKTTGVTVILAGKNGAVAGCSVQGAAPATRETDLLKSGNTVEKIHALVFSGGSAFGLSCAQGVMEFLKENGTGVSVGSNIIPIVVGASIYDLDYQSNTVPDDKMGYAACVDARPNHFEHGLVGAGCGATACKILGMESARKTGQGFASYTHETGLEVAAISVLNPLGDIVDPSTGKFIKKIQTPDHKTTKDLLLACDPRATGIALSNTTISCILTNAKLTKTQANRLSFQAHDAYARCILPVHTQFDGDAIFVLSSGQVETSLLALQTICTHVLEQAILDAASGVSNSDIFPHIGL